MPVEPGHENDAPRVSADVLWDVELTLGEVDRCNVFVVACREVLLIGARLIASRRISSNTTVLEWLPIEVSHRGDLVGL